MNPKRPRLLIVLDGWGHAEATDWNAVTQAPARHFLEWWERWPRTLLSASGEEVGLPLGLMGNSEVGHTNIGAGRVVHQAITRINADVASGGFARNGALAGAVEHARRGGGRLHLFGLVGDGGVHASDRHYEALLKMAAGAGLPGERVLFHALLDGRDTPPHSAPGFLRDLEEMLRCHGGRVATVCGRYWGMDRDRNWERTARFWNAMVHGRAGHHAGTALEAVEQAAARGESDEFVQPTIVGEPAPVRDGDALICVNFRADRVRQITEALLAGSSFDGFERGAVPRAHFVSMTQYRKDFDCPVAYPPRELHSLFGELVAARGMTQFRCAETEKYAHVTFFFNGGREEVYPGEERLLVPSPKVATYDLKPEMSACEVTAELLRRLERGEHDLYVVNFANPDMVGHTGDQDATERAIRTVDGCLAQIVDAAQARGGVVAITADHGNSEMMRDPATGEKHTAHTTNPVPFLLIGEELRGAKLREMGILADVAPTLMQTMGIAQPPVMDGRSLFGD